VSWGAGVRGLLLCTAREMPLVMCDGHAPVRAGLGNDDDDDDDDDRDDGNEDDDDRDDGNEDDDDDDDDEGDTATRKRSDEELANELGDAVLAHRVEAAQVLAAEGESAMWWSTEAAG
jgi:hypothetical protein